jgi:hypothetical protein
MKFTHNLFTSDILEMTWLDLFKLMLGKELKVSALIVRRASNGS